MPGAMVSAITPYDSFGTPGESFSAETMAANNAKTRGNATLRTILQNHRPVSLNRGSSPPLPDQSRGPSVSGVGDVVVCRGGILDLN